MTSFAVNLVVYPWQDPLGEGMKLAEYFGVPLKRGQLGANGSVRLEFESPMGMDFNGVYEKVIELGARLTSVVFSEANPIIVPPPVPTPPPVPVPPPVIKTLPLRSDTGRTCQDVINVFDRAFGRGVGPTGPWFVMKLKEAGLEGLGIYTNRQATYSVPPFAYIEDMTLSPEDKTKLIEALK